MCTFALCVNLSVEGSLGWGHPRWIPPAEDHSGLCSVNLPQSPKAAAPAAGLESAPFRDLFFFLAVVIINTYLKGGGAGDVF